MELSKALLLTSCGLDDLSRATQQFESQPLAVSCGATRDLQSEVLDVHKLLSMAVKDEYGNSLLVTDWYPVETVDTAFLHHCAFTAKGI